MATSHNELIASSCLAWITLNKMVNENRQPIEFRNHRSLIDYMADDAPMKYTKKAAQVGLTVAETLISFHEAGFKGHNTLHTLQTSDVIKGFVFPKVNPIILENPAISSLVTKDSENLKQIGKNFIYYRGAQAESQAINISVDILNVDEYDRSNPLVVGMLPSRLDASTYRRMRYFSNPSQIGFGVDRLFQESCAFHWFVKCAKCNHDWFMDWSESDDKNHYVDQEQQIFACGKCGSEITDVDRRNGRWVAKYPSREAHGYWFSQLMAPWKTAKEIVSKFYSEPTEVFYNMTLGKAYTPSEILVNRESILRANAPGRPTLKQVCIGVDNGLIKSYIIGSPNGVFRYGETESWEEIESLFLTYDAIMVIDANPYPTMPKKLAEKYPGKVFIHYYSQDRKGLGITRWGEGKDRGVVQSDRTKLLDMIAQEINEAKILFTQSPSELEKFIYHCEQVYRTVEENAQGIMRGEWHHQEGKPDHYFHALAYWRVALSKRMTGGMGEIVRPKEPGTEKAYSPHFDIAKSIKAAKRQENVEYE